METLCTHMHTAVVAHAPPHPCFYAKGLAVSAGLAADSRVSYAVASNQGGQKYFVYEGAEPVDHAQRDGLHHPYLRSTSASLMCILTGNRDRANEGA
jgi:hypothetical protein